MPAALFRLPKYRPRCFSGTRSPIRDDQTGAGSIPQTKNMQARAITTHTGGPINAIAAANSQVAACKKDIRTINRFLDPTSRTNLTASN